MYLIKSKHKNFNVFHKEIQGKKYLSLRKWPRKEQTTSLHRHFLIIMAVIRELQHKTHNTQGGRKPEWVSTRSGGRREVRRLHQPVVLLLVEVLGPLARQL